MILLTNIGVLPPAGLSRVVMLNPSPSFPGEGKERCFGALKDLETLLG